MAKPKTGNEIIDPSTGEVIPAELLDGMLGDVDAGLGQSFKTDDLIIPRITILQDLSPQVKERKVEYIPGAKPGMIYNSVNNALDQSISFVPAMYHTSWVAWKPRPDGGLVNNNVDASILTEEKGFMADGIDRFVGTMADPTSGGEMKKVEVIKTPEWVGVARGESGWIMPVAISFPATKAKSARKINTSIDLTEVEVQGRIITPPPFYHTFILSSAIEQSGENEWYGWTVTHDGYANTDPRMRAKAKDIRKSLEEGKASVAEHTDQS